MQVCVFLVYNVKMVGSTVTKDYKKNKINRNALVVSQLSFGAMF